MVRPLSVTFGPDGNSEGGGTERATAKESFQLLCSTELHVDGSLHDAPGSFGDFPVHSTRPASLSFLRRSLAVMRLTPTASATSPVLKLARVAQGSDEQARVAWKSRFQFAVYGLSRQR